MSGESSGRPSDPEFLYACQSDRPHKTLQVQLQLWPHFSADSHVPQALGLIGHNILDHNPAHNRLYNDAMWSPKRAYS
jgi:hypothetical protein